MFYIFEKNSKIQNGRHFWQMKYLLKLGKASLHRYHRCGSKILPGLPIFPILCFAFFVKNSKIDYEPHFWGGENFWKIGESRLVR